jgi:PTS system nitrogen regulatory IIA component
MEEQEYFSGGFVCDLESTDKYKAIRELVNKLPRFRDMFSRKEFESEVMFRERRQSTGLGHGVAVAHGHAPVDSILIGLGVARGGIEYDAIDKKPVDLLFIIANPPEKKCEYLRVLSALVKLLRNPSFRLAIRRCGTCVNRETLLKKAFQQQLVKEKI